MSRYKPTDFQILVDRSRTETLQRCPRKFYYSYLHEGGGVSSEYISWPLLVGTCVHEGLEHMLKGEPIGICVEKALARFVEEVGKSQFDLEEIGLSPKQEDVNLVDTSGANQGANDGQDYSFLPDVDGGSEVARGGDYWVDYTVKEQMALVEALLRAYYVSDKGLAWLLEEYEVREVEREELESLGEMAQIPKDVGWHSGEGGDEIGWMARLDGLLEQRLTGDLFVLSWKTAAEWEGRKISAGESDMQGMSEVCSVQERLRWWAELCACYFREWQNTIPEDSEYHSIPGWFKDRYNKLGKDACWQIAGVQMIFLIKGERRKNNQTGVKEQSCSLIRPYVKRDANGGMEFAMNYNYTKPDGSSGKLGPKYKRTNIWELEGVTVEAFVNAVKSDVGEDGGCALDEFIVNAPPFRRDQGRLRSWARQKYNLYTNIGIDAFKPYQYKGKSISELEKYLDRVFPQYEHSCSYPSKCVFFNQDWNSSTYRDNMLEFEFKPRIPHHEAEAELVQIIRRE